MHFILSLLTQMQKKSKDDQNSSFSPREGLIISIFLLRTAMTIQLSDIWICLLSFRFLDQNLRQFDRYKSEFLDSRKKKLEAKVEASDLRNVSVHWPQKTRVFLFTRHSFLPVSCSCSTLLEPFSATGLPAVVRNPLTVCSRQRHPILFTPATPFSCTQKEPAWSMLELVIYNIHMCGWDV